MIARIREFVYRNKWAVLLTLASLLLMILIYSIGFLRTLLILLIGLSVIKPDMVAHFFTSWCSTFKGHLTLAVFALILGAICVRIILLGTRRRIDTEETAVVAAGENGGTFIALSAVESIVDKYLKKQSGINSFESAVGKGKNGVTIGLRLWLNADGQMADYTGRIREGIRSHVERYAGVSVEEISAVIEEADTRNAETEDIPLETGSPEPETAEEAPMEDSYIPDDETEPEAAPNEEEDAE